MDGRYSLGFICDQEARRRQLQDSDDQPHPALPKRRRIEPSLSTTAHFGRTRLLPHGRGIANPPPATISAIRRTDDRAPLEWAQRPYASPYRPSLTNGLHQLVAAAKYINSHHTSNRPASLYGPPETLLDEGSAVAESLLFAVPPTEHHWHNGLTSRGHERNDHHLHQQSFQAPEQSKSQLLSSQSGQQNLPYSLPSPGPSPSFDYSSSSRTISPSSSASFSNPSNLSQTDVEDLEAPVPVDNTIDQKHLPSTLGTEHPPKSFIPLSEIDQVRTSIAHLLEEMRTCLSSDGLATPRDNYFGTARLLFANGVNFVSECTLQQPASECDIIRMSQAEFRKLMHSGHPPVKPVIIEPDTGLKTGTSQVNAFLSNLEYGYSDSLIDVQNMSDEPAPNGGTAIQLEASSLQHYLTANRNATLTRSHWPRNLLNLHGLMTTNAPPLGLSEPPSANILRHALFRRRAVANKTSAGKGGALTPYAAIDYAESCLAFTLYSQRGSFSGCHMDVFAGTWVRSLSGRKLWPLCFDLSADDWVGFCARGPGWIPPADKLRCVLIREGETLIMPPSGRWVHCPLTIEDCLMDGGMFWTAQQILPTLDTVRFIKDNIASITNEDMPASLPEILDALLKVLERMEGVDMPAVRDRVTELKKRFKPVRIRKRQR